MKALVKTCLIFAFSIFSLTCSQNQDDGFQDRVQSLKERIKNAEALLGENNPAATVELKKWLFQLKEAEQFSLETQEERGVEILERVQKELEKIVDGRDGDLTITHFSGDVTLSGKRVTELAKLLNSSTITTGSRSTAELRLFSDSSITLGPNSTLKISKIIKWGRSFFCTLQRGGLTYRQNGKQTRFYLSAGSRDFDNQQIAEFEVRLLGKQRGYVLPRKSNVHVIFSGKLSKVQFGEGLAWNGTQSKILQPLQAPELISPTLEQTFLPEEGNEIMDVSFTWSEVGQADFYSIDVYKDKTLKQPVVSGTIVREEKWSHKFPNGVFFWRVQPVNKDGLPGYASKVQWFSVVADTGAPHQTDKKPGPKLSKVKIQLMNDMAIVTGRVSGKASVSVNHKKTMRTLDGSFEIIVSLPYGEQWITIVATADDGSQTVEKYKVDTSN